MLAPGPRISYTSMSCRDVAQSGRAPRSGRGGRWFKSSRPDHNIIPSSPGQAWKIIQKSDHTWLPHPFGNSIRGVVSFLDDKKCTRNRSPFSCKGRMSNCMFLGSFLYCIP